MSPIIHCPTIDLTEPESKYIHEKAEKLLHLSRKAETDDSIKLRIDLEKDSFKEKDMQFFCSLTLSIPGKTLRSESHGTGVFTVFDDAMSKIKTQFQREKEKHLHL
jgi:ribosomal subunit interface protein